MENYESHEVTTYTEKQNDYVTAETATEQLIESGIELSLLLCVLLILYLYQRFKTHPIILKLRLDPETLKKVLNFFAEKAKNPLSDAAIRKARENNLKIDLIDKNLTREEIKDMTSEAKDKIREKENNLN